MHDILLSFVGNRDPHVEEQELGPVLSLLQAREFSHVVLFCTGASYLERGRMVEEISRSGESGTRFNYVSMELQSPIDYEEIYRELRRSVDQLMPTIAHLPHRLSILLDPGTPQMQTAWFLLVASGYLEADLLQGVPPRFAGGAYKVRTVDLTHDIFPGLTIARTDGTGVVAVADRAPQGWIGEPDTAALDAAGERAGAGRWIQSSTPDIIGSNPAFRDVMDQALQLASYDISVVLAGETGTGKEVVAGLIHSSSPRSHKPFLAVNCAAVSPSLAESELFGHEKGAFTGAQSARLGKFRAANGGTVFLDEVGDLAPETQAKLLRVLEDGLVVPVGGDAPVAVDVRVIAATNRDLGLMLQKGTFRQDLYQRLAQMTLYLPPLRERPEDIPLLLRHFVDRWNAKYHESKGLAEETVRFLMEYPWPGNVRELKNVVEATCAMGRSSQIGPGLLPPDVRSYFQQDASLESITAAIPEDGLDLRALLNNVEKTYYERALTRTEGNAERAAKLLGINGAAFRKAARERLGIRWREPGEPDTCDQD